MEAKELMIGDWVICNYYLDKPFYHQFGLGDFTKCGYEFCEPIPLTPDILEKNGFTKSTPPPGIHAKCYELDNKKDRYNLTIADYNKYKRLLLNVDSENSECFNIKCDYVHELQHALRLCGIDEEIKL